MPHFNTNEMIPSTHESPTVQTHMNVDKKNEWIEGRQLTPDMIMIVQTNMTKSSMFYIVNFLSNTFQHVE